MIKDSSSSSAFAFGFPLFIRILNYLIIKRKKIFLLIKNIILIKKKKFTKE